LGLLEQGSLERVHATAKVLVPTRKQRVQGRLPAFGADLGSRFQLCGTDLSNNTGPHWLVFLLFFALFLLLLYADWHLQSRALHLITSTSKFSTLTICSLLSSYTCLKADNNQNQDKRIRENADASQRTQVYFDDTRC